MCLDDSKLMFRFRSIAALLESDPEKGGFQELEKQEIYFARPDSLNDPMEGLTDAFWHGDDVLWENLLRHYALALLWYSGAWLVFKSDEIDQARVNAGLTAEDLPTDAFRAVYYEFCSSFCAAIGSTDLATKLGRATVPMRRERLVAFLFLVHQTALHHLFRTLKEHRLFKFDLPEMGNAESVRTIVDLWEKLMQEPPTATTPVEHQLEILGRISNRANDQLELGALSRGVDGRAKKWIAIMARFPEMYVEALLADLHFTPWRVACFSRRCVNASMWGTYGHEHRGAVLVLRTVERAEKRFFRVRGMIGTGPQGCDLEVRPVIYRPRPPPLDSFLAIGRLPMAKLERTWMKSRSGKPSIRLHEITADMDAWRRAQWQSSFERASWKHTDWSHEEELRVIASSPSTDDPAPRPLSYEFSQLEGIVFGMRTTTEDKLKIAQVIEQKCRAERRSDFRFFQAHYSPQRGEMEVAELGLLKFEQS